MITELKEMHLGPKSYRVSFYTHKNPHSERDELKRRGRRKRILNYASSKLLFQP